MSCNSLSYCLCAVDTRPLVETDDYCWMPYQIARAEYVPFQQKLAKEEEIYFVPSAIESEKCCISLRSELVVIDW